MKTIIAGSKAIKDPFIIENAIKKLDWDITELVSSGGINSIDIFAEKWAEKNNIPIKQFVAEYTMYGEAAKQIRNQLMAKYADACLIIRDNKTRSAQHIMTEAKELGLKIVILLEDEINNVQNPIKKNPSYNEEQNNVATKTISINGKSLVIYEDEKRNSQIINFVVEMKKEIEKMKKNIEHLRFGGKIG